MKKMVVIFRIIFGLVSLLQMDMMYWDVYWNAANRNDLWIPFLGVTKYTAFCTFWILAFTALTVDVWFKLLQKIKQKLGGDDDRAI